MSNFPKPPMRIKLLLSLFFLLLISSAYSQSELSDKASVSILTCETGNEIYSLFGHTAIRIKDPVTMLDVVYNYGAFDFSTPNFGLRFSRGDLQYFVTAENYNDFLLQYYVEKRSVYEQELNLTANQKNQLFNTLNEVMQSDARFYTYKFIDRNCTNMAVDDLNDVLGGKVIVKRNIDGSSYRDIIFPYFDEHFYEQWGISILFGTKTDQIATTLFLPSEFMHSLSVTKYKGEKIASEAKTILNFPKQPKAPSIWNNVYTYLILITLVLVFNKKKWVRAAYFVIIGLLGLFFIWAMLYSLHAELKSNYNLLLFNPLLIVLAYLIYRPNHRFTIVVAMSCLICIAIYLVMIFQKAHALIVFPIVLANAALLVKMLLNARRSIARDKKE